MGFRARGRLGSHWGLKYPYFHPETGFYRHPQGDGDVYRVRNGVQERYPYYPPGNPQWVNQQRWREIQSYGVIAAQALTDEQRVPYAAVAKGTKMGSWFNAFMSEWLTLHGPIIYEWGYEYWESKKWG